MLKNSIIVVLSFLCFIFIVSQLQPSLASDRENMIRLAHIESFEPFAAVQDGKSEGLAVDIITAALELVSYKVEFIGVEQDKEKDFLKEGKVDGLAFFGMNPERKQVYDFSDPYLMTGGALFVKAPNPASTDLRDFEGKTVATPEKGPLAGYIRKNYPEVKLLTDVKDYSETLQVVVEGKADAAALNTQSGAVLAQKEFPAQFSMPDEGFLAVPIGIGVIKGEHVEFLNKFNEGLKIILKDGTYDRLVEKHGVPKATKPTIH